MQLIVSNLKDIQPSLHQRQEYMNTIQKSEKGKQ